MRIVSALVLVSAVASTASAQSAYVGASFIGDFIRVSDSTFDDGGNGETFGGALRAGVPLGAQWGVELEFARTGTTEATPDVFLAMERFTIAPFDDPSLFRIPQFHAERQLSTVSTMAWWSHEVTPHVSLVYLGGVAFTRAASEFRVSFQDFGALPGRLPGLIFPPRSIEQERTSYDADVAVGFEARIGMTEHLRLTPGIRMQTAVGGWAIRPGVGLQWMF